MDEERIVTSTDYITALEKLGYTFRMNECNDELEVNGEPMTDPLRSEIRTKMRDVGFKAVGIMEDVYIAYALRQRYHPIKNYLWGLEHDGADYISQVASCFKDQHGVFGLWFRKWLIGAVMKACTDGVMNPMLVLDGGQGIGKSSFVRWLGSAVDGYFIEAPIDPSDKDDFVRLASTWIWEVAELGATARRADQEALKHFISRQQVQVRKAYGRYDIHKPALASFVGTVNNESGLLTDATGSRRFLICKLESIDWSYSDIDVNQLWAQAMALYKGGETNYLDNSQMNTSSTINEEYEIDNPILGMVEKYLDIDPSNEDWWTSTTDILELLTEKGLTGHSRQNAMSLAVAMTRLGVNKKKQTSRNNRRIWGYVGIHIPSDF